MKNILPIILFLFINYSFSQDRIAVGSKTYDATKEFEFKQNSSTNGYHSSIKYDEHIKISFGKKENGGVVLLQKLNLLYPAFGSNSSKTLKIEAKIKGDLFLYLSNATVIKCIDRKIRGYMDDISSSLYYLTKSEVEDLKKYDVVSVSYKLESGLNHLSSYSADNSNSNTSEAIKQLF